MQSITQQIITTLNGLGQTRDDIANALRRKGIKGTRATSEMCPLANYLHEQFPEVVLQVGCYSGGELLRPQRWTHRAGQPVRRPDRLRAGLRQRGFPGPGELR